MTKKSLDSSNGVALKVRTRITITGLLLLAVAAALLNIQQQSSLAFAAREEDKNVLYVCKEDITTDIFELASGIFAAILFVLSLRAYRKLKIKGMLFVSAAFGIFAARTIAIETRDLYLGGGESSAIESALSIMFLMAIVLFFIAIVQREKIKPRPQQPDI
ncbi:MAG: hypothetical protein WAJ93_08170 [Candidatus Nitrosopolaris sp.]